MTKRDKFLLTFAVAALAAVGAYWLVPWQQLSIQRQQAAYEAESEAIADAEYDAWMREPINPNAMFDARVEGFGDLQTAPNGVDYMYVGDGVSYSGSLKPDVPMPAPDMKLAKRKQQMYRDLAAAYDPDRHGSLLDHRHKDERGVYFEFDGKRIDVVTR